MFKTIYKKIASSLSIALAAIAFSFSMNANAAFPDDLNSGVVFIEEGIVPGTGAFIASFAQTATLDARITGGNVIMEYDKKNTWPLASGQIGTTNLNCCVANAWAFIEVDGVWYGGTWEFLRNGQTGKLLSALTGPKHLRLPPLQNYVARNGDVIGLMVAGITRAGLQFNNVRERSNIVFYRVGGGVVDPSELGFTTEEPTPEATDAAVDVSPILQLLDE